MKKYLLLLLLCSLCQAQSIPEQNSTFTGVHTVKVNSSTYLVISGNFGETAYRILYPEMIPTEYQPVTAMLDEPDRTCKDFACWTDGMVFSDNELRLNEQPEKNAGVILGWHLCTVDEVNRYYGQGAVVPIAYCKNINNHIPMCKPDSKPDEVCWEPR